MTPLTLDARSRALIYLCAPRCASVSLPDAPLLGVTALAAQLARMGAAAAVPQQVESQGEPHELWADANAELMRRCDAALFVEFWTRCPQARRDHRTALQLGLPRFFALRDLAWWLQLRATRARMRAPVQSAPLAGAA